MKFIKKKRSIRLLPTPISRLNRNQSDSNASRRGITHPKHAFVVLVSHSRSVSLKVFLAKTLKYYH